MLDKIRDKLHSNTSTESDSNMAGVGTSLKGKLILITGCT